MKGETLKKVVHCAELTAYALPKKLLAILQQTDKLRAYNTLAGRPALSSIRLFRHDFNLIDNAVRKQSEGKFSASSVFYRGLPLIPHDEAPKSFSLEAS